MKKEREKADTLKSTRNNIPCVMWLPVCFLIYTYDMQKNGYSLIVKGSRLIVTTFNIGRSMLDRINVTTVGSRSESIF